MPISATFTNRQKAKCRKKDISKPNANKICALDELVRQDGVNKANCHGKGKSEAKCVAGDHISRSKSMVSSAPARNR